MNWDGLLGAAHGDLKPFEAFCRAVDGPLLGYVRARVRNADDAEDITQESLYRLYRMIRGREVNSSRGSPRALVFSIAHNLAVDYLRRRKAVVSLDKAKHVSIDPKVEANMLRQQVEKAVRTLPENQRDALLLREFGGLSYAEISETLGATIGQVRTWIFRGRKTLAGLIDRDGQYVGELRNG